MSNYQFFIDFQIRPIKEKKNIEKYFYFISSNKSGENCNEETWLM